MQHMNPWYALSGLAVGFLVGLTGVGGGALVTPLLISAFGVPAAVAVGTDLLYTAASRGAAAIIHSVSRNIGWRVAWLLTAGAISATLAALVMLWRFGPQGEVTKSVITHRLRRGGRAPSGGADGRGAAGRGGGQLAGAEDAGRRSALCAGGADGAGGGEAAGLAAARHGDCDVSG